MVCAYQSMTPEEHWGVVFGRHVRGFRPHARPHFRIIAGECLITVGCFEHRSVLAPPRGPPLCSDKEHPTVRYLPNSGDGEDVTRFFGCTQGAFPEPTRLDGLDDQPVARRNILPDSARVTGAHVSMGVTRVPSAPFAAIEDKAGLLTRLDPGFLADVPCVKG